MTDEFRVADDVADAWRRLAKEVREALNLAGIPSQLMEDLVESPGAEIGIDFGVGWLGGVFIVWRPGDILYKDVLAAATKGDTDAPAFVLGETIRKHMRDAILQILKALGFEVTALDEYEIMPPAINVHKGPTAG